MKSLTSKQSRIYNFIADWLKSNGYPPSQAEIREHFQFGSLNAVRSHLLLIERKGYIHLSSGKARGIQLTTPPLINHQQGDNSIPLLGHIAAGVPIWAEENFEDCLPIPPSIFGDGDLFALRVSGDSMAGVGIRNDDIAVIQKQSQVENGEIAAVLIDQEATLKRVYTSANSLVLKSENPTFDDLKYTNESRSAICILGRYQGIIRAERKRYYS
ncbi:repressor LexA [Malonomonas rubra DSM 5091]|uniref:LexA repressor n=1 Tax=Malonomonas rubra DSM 5091 TaxID=1122189 RepID=A0A1M6H8N7_MALRU|nr:transcriptional repressor LexA [Malonomonas rubra]SHJ18443.1 repressor LexA [Malonomonas rubra DSM 5091]